jgi:hypothetical protein
VRPFPSSPPGGTNLASASSKSPDLPISQNMRLRSRVALRRSSRSRATVATARPYHLAAMNIVDETGLNDRLQRAADPATSPWHLAELVDDPDPEIRRAVATNTSASELTRHRLQQDPDPAVRAAAGERYDIGA